MKKISKDRRYKVSVKGKAYDVILHPDTEDGGFWVECPTLPGCSSQGDTVEDALSMIKDAIKGHLAGAGGEEEKEGGSIDVRPELIRNVRIAIFMSDPHRPRQF